MEKFDRGYSYNEAKDLCDEMKKLDKRSDDFVDQTVNFFYNNDYRTKPYCTELYEYRKELVR